MLLSFQRPWRPCGPERDSSGHGAAREDPERAVKCSARMARPLVHAQAPELPFSERQDAPVEVAGG